MTIPREMLLSKPVLHGVPARNPFPGFRNLGNTCYANAMLQCLFHCDCVRVQWRQGPDSEFALRHAVVALLEEYTSLRCDVILPYAFLSALQTSMAHLGNVVSTQQDCQEVLSFLLAAHTSGLTLSLPHAVCQEGLLLTCSVGSVMGDSLEKAFGSPGPWGGGDPTW